MMNPTLSKKNIELDIILKDPDLMLDADRTWFEQY